jgi:hypothetical protein
MEGLPMYRYVTAVVLLLAVLAAPLRAFDTGHHADLTRAALSRQGIFSDDAIRTVQVANWLPDYYSADLRDVVPINIESTRGNYTEVRRQVEKLHFDGLLTNQAVNNYWVTLAFNTRSMVQTAAKAIKNAGAGTAAKRDRVREFLVILGASLHAVQDFYTHSNWVEQHPKNGQLYRNATWWSEVPRTGSRLGDNPNNELCTGWYKSEHSPTRPQTRHYEHGTYSGLGLNHDSYCRQADRKWDEAYVFAYCGTREWVDAVLNWATEAGAYPGDGLASDLLGYRSGDQPSFATGTMLSKETTLAEDVEASRKISEWIQKGTRGEDGYQNGHWKGEGSGWASGFQGMFLTPGAWGAAGKNDSKILTAFRRPNAPVQNKLAENLYTSFRPTLLANQAPPALVVNGGTAVSIRTTSVETSPKEALVYAEIKVGEDGADDTFIEYAEAMQNLKGVTGAIQPKWWTIHFDGRTSGKVRIMYRLKAYPNTEYNLGGATGGKALSFTYDLQTAQLAGDVTGVHNSSNSAVEKGPGVSSPTAKIKFFVTSTPMQ